MIGLDTNVLVRYIAQDDERQSAKATQLIEASTAEKPAYISLVVLVEAVWVLTGAYEATRDDIAEIIEDLLRSKEIVLARPDLITQALRTYKQSKADFADCIIERDALSAGCQEIYSFDKAAVKSGVMRLL